MRDHHDIRPSRRRLLADSWGPERVPARPDPLQTRWFEALDVRDEAAARDRWADRAILHRER